MGLLDSIGAGLRGGGLAAAGALSGDVYREQAGQREAKASAARQQQAAVAQYILQAVHSGAVSDEHLPELQQTMAKMGYNIPIDAFGPGIEAKYRLANHANELAKQRRATAAATELANYQFGGAPGPGGLMPQGTGGGLSGPQTSGNLAQLGAMFPGGMPQSSGGMQFTPDMFDSSPAPAATPPAPAAAMPGTPEGVQAFAYDQDKQSESTLFGDPMAQDATGHYQMPTANVTDRMPRSPSVPQQSVAPVPIAAPVAPAQAGPNGAPVGPNYDDLYRRAVNAAVNGVPGGKEVLEYVIKMREAAGKPEVSEVGRGGTLVDKRTGKIIYQGSPELKAHVVDGALVDESGNVIYKGSPDAIKSVQEFNAMLDQAGVTEPGKRQQMWAEYAMRKGSGVTVNTGQPKAPTGYRYREDASGDLEAIPGGPGEKQLTEIQAKNVAFGMRAKKANLAATEIEGSTKEVGSLLQSIKDNLGAAGNYRTSPEMQRYNQAKMEFISSAVLRLDSGAAISASEYDKYNKAYFPQVGDSAEVMKQKAASRASVVEGMAIGAGKSGAAEQMEVEKRLGTGKSATSQNSPKGAPAPPPPGVINNLDIPSTIREAQKAIAKGADKNKVKRKLLQNGFPAQMVADYLGE